MKLSNPSFLKIIFAFGFALSFVPQTLLAQGARAGIEAWHKKYLDTAKKGDAAAAAKLFTRDAQLLYGEEGGGTIRGREAIEKSLEGYFQWLRTEGIKLEVEDTEVEEHGDTAHNTGKYVERKADGSVVGQGTYLGIWKREDGEWKLHRDTFASTLPKKGGLSEWSPAQKELWEVEEKSAEAFKSMDIEKVSTFYHDDYLSWYSGSPFPSTKKELKKILPNYWKSNRPVTLQMRPVGIIIHGDTGIVHYSYLGVNVDPSNKETVEKGRWTDVWVKENGKWLLIADHGGPESSGK